MKTIKLAPYTKDGKIFGENSDFDIRTIIDDYTKSMMTDPGAILSNWFYLDGDLQSMVEYDCGIILNYGELDKVFTERIPNDWYDADVMTNISIVDGIYDVEIYNIDKPCIAYLWNDDENRLRGLICLKTDIEACKKAYQKFCKQPRIL